MLKELSPFNHVPLPYERGGIRSLHQNKKFHLFAIKYFKNLINGREQQLIQYLEGSISIDDLGITPENGADFLRATKLTELMIGWQNRISAKSVKFKRSTFAIRTRILELCSPQMTSSEAFTKTLNRSKMHEKAYLMNPRNWVPERMGLYAKLIANQYILTRALSARLNNKLPVMVALKGNTGAGKTTMLKHIVGPEESRSGILNLDLLKPALRQGINLLSKQIHEEASALFANLARQLFIETVNLSLIVDARLDTMESFDTYLVRPFGARKGTARIVDIDVPLKTSIIRVLVRHRFGPDPCVPLRAIIDGFVQTRQSRQKMIEQIKTSKQIDHYQLHHWDKDGHRTLVAEKTKEAFKIFSENAYTECVRVPMTDEITNTITQLITQTYIDDAIVRSIIYPAQKKQLESWLGLTLFQAMEQHTGDNSLNFQKAFGTSK